VRSLRGVGIGYPRRHLIPRKSEGFPVRVDLVKYFVLSFRPVRFYRFPPRTKFLGSLTVGSLGCGRINFVIGISPFCVHKLAYNTRRKKSSAFVSDSGAKNHLPPTYAHHTLARFCPYYCFLSSKLYYLHYFINFA
jgi:hypothetical protein